MPSAILAPRPTATAVARRPRVRRALARAAHRPGGAGLPRVGLAGPARSSEWIVLCTGYDACANGRLLQRRLQRRHAARSYWSQSTGHNCTNYVAYRLVTNGLPNKRPAALTRQRLQLGARRSRRRPTTPRPSARSPGGDSPSPAPGTSPTSRRSSRPTEILVSEDNWGGDFRWRTVTRSGGCWPAGFIHLKDLGPPVAAPASYPTYRPVPPARIVDTRSWPRGDRGPLARRKRHEHPRQRQGGSAQDRAWVPSSST